MVMPSGLTPMSSRKASKDSHLWQTFTPLAPYQHQAGLLGFPHLALMFLQE